MIGSAIDSLIGVLSPAWAAKRMLARATMAQIESYSGGKSGYEAGRVNRLTRGRNGGPQNENGIPSDQVDRLRWSSWNLYRNNPHARKIVRTITAKVIGRGIVPRSGATNVDGTPHTAFRTRAQQLWAEMGRKIDFSGTPGTGGQSMTGLQKLALKSIILNGEVLFKMRTPYAADIAQRRLPVPKLLQLIDATRLTDLSGIPVAEGNVMYRGIELDSTLRRAAYHIADNPPMEFLAASMKITARRVPAEGVGHLFIAEDIDQLRGVPWFAPCLMQARDTGDYQYNEMKASAIASCVVLGYRKATGARHFGLANPDAAEPAGDLVDGDGNPITAMQPGMMINLGRDGELVGFNPARPSTSAEAWINHMVRTMAVGMGGVKASTLTGDYRNASFSSERSADNDVWPELEDLQDWFAEGFCQPVFEQIVTAGVEAGYFDGIVTAVEFLARKNDFLAAEWQGPVARSINPVDDANAATLRIKAGVSSPQLECAQLGRNWQEIAKQIAEFYQFCKDQGLPEEVANNVMSVDKSDVTQDAASAGQDTSNGGASDGAAVAA